MDRHLLLSLTKNPFYHPLLPPLPQLERLALCGIHFAASENTDAKDRSSGGFSPMHPWVAKASG
jgi:hypothetical protein